MECDGTDLHSVGRKIDGLPPKSRTSLRNTSICRYPVVELRDVREDI